MGKNGNTHMAARRESTCVTWSHCVVASLGFRKPSRSWPPGAAAGGNSLAPRKQRQHSGWVVIFNFILRERKAQFSIERAEEETLEALQVKRHQYRARYQRRRGVRLHPDVPAPSETFTTRWLSVAPKDVLPPRLGVDGAGQGDGAWLGIGRGCLDHSQLVFQNAPLMVYAVLQRPHHALGYCIDRIRMASRIKTEEQKKQHGFISCHAVDERGAAWVFVC
ncbi:hypothetical protein E2C01_025497 [Portunus trituberculatus]|uniref:Uncharacterized protein n=1 Tax=Portunus trituberculatus TaxID=210409 RepID=A0A5B7ED28_PORTR|nr:hypothetical protein [Portunus trituberculatus]